MRFRVRDIYHPEPTEILHELHDNDSLTGKVVDLCDNAHTDGSPFVVVKIDGVRAHCFVSVDRLLRRKKAPVEL